MANNNIIQGSSFDLSYRRTTHEPIDCSSVFKTLEDARVYALNNCKEEAFVPYAGQIISVLENNAVYKLVKAENVVEIEERKEKPHYQLALVGSQNDNDDRYLRKDIAETVDKLMTFIEGINVKGTATLAEITLLKNIVSKNFAAGATGFGITRDEDGNYHLDIDFVDIRKKLNVNEIQVQRSTYIGGKQYNTHGGIICDRVEDRGDAYRCYFKTTDAEGRTVRNTFEAGDLAISETFALKTGTTFYWRYVSGCGDNYIDLSKTDCARGSDAPAAGDNIVQLGNRSVTSRQGAIVWDSVTPGGPYVRIYKDINSYTMPEPVIDLNTVLSEISAKLINRATGKDVDEILEDLQADMDKVREQTDKMFVIWFDEYVPTLSNLPASGWTDDATKASHEQDLFYNTSKNVASGGGRAYRFEKSSNGSYRWAEVTDKDTVAALEAAAKAQSTADGKRRVFVSRPKDSDVYDIGDLWVNAEYSDGKVIYTNDSLVCIAAKAEGASFSIAHWRPTSTATTAYLENLGDRIIAAVSDSEKGLAEAKKLARQGIDDAYNAAQSALESLGLAGSAAEMAKDAQDTSSENTAAIQVTKDSIAALAQGIHFDKSGKITNINTSGLVTTEDFNVLLSKKVHMDSEGHITNISTSGLVTEAGFAQMFSERADADGYVKRAEISTFITEDEAGRLISNAEINADRIRFNGNIIANNSFVVDKEGNVRMNNATVTGEINAITGSLGKIDVGDFIINGSKDLDQGFYYNVNNSSEDKFGTMSIRPNMFSKVSRDCLLRENDTQRNVFMYLQRARNNRYDRVFYASGISEFNGRVAISNINAVNTTARLDKPSLFVEGGIGFVGNFHCEPIVISKSCNLVPGETDMEHGWAECNFLYRVTGDGITVDLQYVGDLVPVGTMLVFITAGTNKWGLQFSRGIYSRNTGKVTRIEVTDNYGICYVFFPEQGGPAYVGYFI